MAKHSIAVIDLVNNKTIPTNIFARTLDANQSNIMTQAVAVWCEETGHRVAFVSSGGGLPGPDRLPADCDVVIISAFTRSAQLAYAISNFFRSRGAVTILGGPHARAYRHDAAKYFDYVVGFLDRALLRDLLQDCSPARSNGVRSGGVYVSAESQPAVLPTLRERWKFIEHGQKGTSLGRMVHMIGSLGCPYRCSFCSDADVKYQTLDFEQIKDDLRFLLQNKQRPAVAWDDPNFGIRFDDYMDAVEAAAPPDSIDFFCHISLSILTEKNLPRLSRNGFRGVMTGIESWYEMGDKSKSGGRKGIEKVNDLAQRVNLVLSYIPYVQTNIILGLDSDYGYEPFDLTREFAALVPGAVPYITLITAYGDSAPLNERYRQDRRILPFPFHFLNNSSVSNVRLRNYTWPDFFDHTVTMRRQIYSPVSIVQRFRRQRRAGPVWLPWANLLRALSSERNGKTKRYVHLRRLFDIDRSVRRFWDGESTELPDCYVNQVRRDLGAWWRWLPSGGLHHDPYGPFESIEKIAPTRPEDRLKNPSRAVPGAAVDVTSDH